MLFFIVTVMLGVSCAPVTSAPNNPGKTNNIQFPMGTNINIIYLHHSTGGVIWGGGVPAIIADYNASNGVSYQITERDYPKSSPYGWKNYPFDYWYLWVSNAGTNQVETEDTLEILTLAYDVIVFKHCYPVSEIGPDSGPGNVTSEVKTISNYVLQYNALKTKMHEFPGNRFIVWTGAAKLEATEVNTGDSQRAHDFFHWVVNTWDEPGDNIYVWDFFTLETEGGNYLLTNYAEAPGNDHPNAVFAGTVAPYFCNRLIDVIQGLGDNDDYLGTNL